MTPKSLLRHKKCISDISEFSKKSTFHRVLEDDDYAKIKNLLELKKRDDKINKELSKIVEEKKEELLKLASTEAVEDTISSELERQIELSIGQAMAAEYNAIIIDGMEDVLAAAVDQAVAEAVNEGISAAAAEAGIRAWLDVLARGGSEQDAWDAGCDAAGLERGC